MQLTHEDLLAGKYNDIEAWVCSFHYRTLNLSKATRNIPPTKALICFNGNFTNGYLQQYPIYKIKINLFDKNGNIGKEISYSDNTSFNTTFLSVFDNEKDCIDHYANMIKIVHTNMRSELGKYIIQRNQQIDTIKELQKKWEK